MEVGGGSWLSGILNRALKADVAVCSRAGETLGIPALFAKAVGAATKGVTCVGCSHSHYLAAPVAAVGVAGASV